MICKNLKKTSSGWSVGIWLKVGRRVLVSKVWETERIMQEKRAMASEGDERGVRAERESVCEVGLSSQSSGFAYHNGRYLIDWCSGQN